MLARCLHHPQLCCMVHQMSVAELPIQIDTRQVAAFCKDRGFGRLSFERRLQSRGSTQMPFRGPLEKDCKHARPPNTWTRRSTRFDSLECIDRLDSGNAQYDQPDAFSKVQLAELLIGALVAGSDESKQLSMRALNQGWSFAVNQSQNRT